MRYNARLCCLQLAGLALIALGAYLIASGHSFAFFTGSEFFSGAAILIVCGIVVLIVTLVGLIGAFFNHRLFLYIVSMYMCMNSYATLGDRMVPSVSQGMYNDKLYF